MANGNLRFCQKMGPEGPLTTRSILIRGDTALGLEGEFAVRRNREPFDWARPAPTPIAGPRHENGLPDPGFSERGPRRTTVLAALTMSLFWPRMDANKR